MTRTRGDTIPDSARSVMRVISLGGAGGDPGVADVIDGALASLIRKRRVKWHRRFAEAVAEIGARTGEPELAALCRNEHFLTVALEAAQIAWRNHHDDKLSALKCAVIHSALPGAPEEQLQLMFLRYVDELTPAHVTVLAMLDGPGRWMDRQGVGRPHWRWGTVSSLIQYCVPPLRGQPEAIEQIVRELQTRGLAGPGQFLRSATSDQRLLDSRTTEFGKAFLSYIGEPWPARRTL